MSGTLFDEGFMSKLENMSLHFKNAVNSVYTGGRRSKSHGSTVEFSDFREYTPGDDYRRIDWNAYARFEKFFIKLYLDEKQLHTRILLDTSKSMDFGEPNKGFLAKRLAAAFAYMAIGSLDRASIYSVSEHMEHVCSGIEGRNAFYKSLERLAAVPFKGESRLFECVKDIRNIYRGDGAAIIISDLLTDSDYKAMIDYLLYYKQQIILVHILSPDELNPQYSGRVRLLDSEGNDNRDLDITPRTLDLYKRTLRSFMDDIASFCAKRGVYLLQISSDESLESILLGKGHSLGIIS